MMQWKKGYGTLGRSALLEFELFMFESGFSKRMHTCIIMEFLSGGGGCSCRYRKKKMNVLLNWY
jgi:hypothetical protein